MLSFAQHRALLRDVTKEYLTPKTYEIVTRRVSERERGIKGIHEDFCPPCSVVDCKNLMDTRGCPP